MEIEDGVIWVYGIGEDGVQEFTDFGIENLIELLEFYKENPGLLRRYPAAYAEWVPRPKPMVEIGGKPILWRILKIYAHFGITSASGDRLRCLQCPV